jgi:hypothetical protein
MWIDGLFRGPGLLKADGHKQDEDAYLCHWDSLFTAPWLMGSVEWEEESAR